MTGSREALVILAHPLDDSLCAHFAGTAHDALASSGRNVRTRDLYKLGFDPVLTAGERRTYYAATYVGDAVPDLVEALRNAETIVLVFPTWWFAMPAILKGFVDRIFTPGVAFDHAPDFGPIRPLLHRLRDVVVVTTMGSPWWVDRLVMHRPVRRVLRWAVFKTCAPQARFVYLPFYLAENPGAERVARFDERLGRCLGQLSR